MNVTLGPGLMATTGQHAYDQPVHASIAYMRGMIPIFYEVTHKVNLIPNLYLSHEYSREYVVTASHREQCYSRAGGDQHC